MKKMQNKISKLGFLTVTAMSIAFLAHNGSIAYAASSVEPPMGVKRDKEHWDARERAEKEKRERVREALRKFENPYSNHFNTRDNMKVGGPEEKDGAQKHEKHWSETGEGPPRDDF